MTFFSFYGQPSCTPGPGGHPDEPYPEPQRHGHRGVSGPGWQLPAAEASVLKAAGYHTFFTGKCHLGEDDYAPPTALPRFVVRGSDIES